MAGPAWAVCFPLDKRRDEHVPGRGAGVWLDVDGFVGLGVCLGWGES